ncbi:MAG: holo-ACP synthase [Eubacteriales bacterium]|nr:holo-ACP synthase [Eubacteriales bacterium]
MILGIGVDIIEIERVQKTMRKALFYTRYFTKAEIALFASRKDDPEVVAGNFAAKEAVLKCLECGIGDLALIDIEILRKESGRPYVTLHGKAMQRADQLGVCRVHVSISHIRQCAVAQAVAEGE